MRPARRRFIGFVDDFLNSTVKGDSRTLRSLVVMLKHPGELSRATAEGWGGRYTTPVKMFFAVIVFYTLFFAFSPIKVGQLWLGTNVDYATYERLPFSSDVEGEWTALFIHFFVPERETMFEPHLAETIELDGAEAVAFPPFEDLVSLYGRPAAERRVRDVMQTMLAYGPLLILFPAILLNGLLHGRRRYLVDHVLYGFEVATAFPLLVVCASLAVLAANALALPLPNDPANSPVFLFVVLPLLFVHAIRSDRRFYESSWIVAPIKALLIVTAWYFTFEILGFHTLTAVAADAAA